MMRTSLFAAFIAVPLAAHAAPAKTKKAPAPVEQPAPAAPKAPPAPATTPAGGTTLAANAPTMNRVATLYGLLGYGYGAGAGFGLGARYQMVVVPIGLLKPNNGTGIRDEIGVEFGLDFVHYSFGFSGFGNYSYNEFIPQVGANWNFWFNDQIAAYPALNLGYRFGSVSGGPSGASFGGVLLTAAAGGIYKLDQFFLRAELGSYLLRLGAGLKF